MCGFLCSFLPLSCLLPWQLVASMVICALPMVWTKQVQLQWIAKAMRRSSNADFRILHELLYCFLTYRFVNWSENHPTFSPRSIFLHFSSGGVTSTIDLTVRLFLGSSLKVKLAEYLWQDCVFAVSMEWFFLGFFKCISRFLFSYIYTYIYMKRSCREQEAFACALLFSFSIE